MCVQGTRTDPRGTPRRIEPDPFAVLCGLCAKLLAVLGTKVFMGFVTAAGAVGLTGLAIHVARPDPTFDEADRCAAVAPQSLEVLRVWLPRAFLELTHSPSRFRVMRTHQDFRQYLKERHEETLWYAYTDRVYQVNGNYCDCTYTKRPYNDPYAFSELCAFLAGMADMPAHFESKALANCAVIAIPDDVVKQDARLAVHQLLDDLDGAMHLWPAP